VNRMMSYERVNFLCGKNKSVAVSWMLLNRVPIVSLAVFCVHGSDPCAELCALDPICFGTSSSSACVSEVCQHYYAAESEGDMPTFDITDALVSGRSQLLCSEAAFIVAQVQGMLVSEAPDDDSDAEPDLPDKGASIGGGYRPIVRKPPPKSTSTAAPR
jgi:hypothetical protein